jgi:hypothetical protein
MRPGGTADREDMNPRSVVPPGLIGDERMLPAPAINDWATFMRPSGTLFDEFLNVDKSGAVPNRLIIIV